MQNKTMEFPTMDLVEGGFTTDGQFVLLRLSTAEQVAIQFSVRVLDLEAFVTFLLQMAANARTSAPAEDRTRYQPIPVSSVSAGELADGMGCLGVTVGGTELMFQLPVAALSDVAHTLLLVGVSEQPQRLS